MPDGTGTPYDDLMSPQALAEAMTPRQQDLASQLASRVGNKPVTTASAWRSARKAGFDIELPSGMVAHVRRTLDLFERLRDGKLPNPLAGIVMEMIEQKKFNIPMDEMGEEALGQMLMMIDETMSLMFIVPKVVLPEPDAPLGWEPEDDAITPADIDLQDKVFLFAVAQGAVADWATFRQQQESLATTVPDGEGVRDQAEHPGGG